MPHCAHSTVYNMHQTSKSFAMFRLIQRSTGSCDATEGDRRKLREEYKKVEELEIRLHKPNRVGYVLIVLASRRL